MKTSITVNKIKFCSDFESGNAYGFEEAKEPNIYMFSGDENNPIALLPHEYNIYISPDCRNSEYETNSKTWFYYSVNNVKEGDILTFNIFNINNQIKLFRSGHRPVFRVGKAASSFNRNNPELGWSRISTQTQHHQDNNIGFIFRFQFLIHRDLPHMKFNAKGRSTVPIFFAFSYPFTFQQLTFKLSTFSKLYTSHPSIYYHEGILAESYQGNPVHILTISGNNNRLTSKEPVEYWKDKNVPHSFANKKIVFISARVHPGETVGSFMCNGFLNFILHEEDPRAKLLRQHFIFKVIPMLNPDGVINGNYRHNARGVNLNRIYNIPSSTNEPEIYNLKKYILDINQFQDVVMLLDLHGHAKTKGAFIYGNYFPTVEDQVNNLLFPKLLSINTQHFDFGASNFSKKNMQEDKSNTGRVTFFNELGIPHIYTLEANYHIGRKINPHFDILKENFPTHIKVNNLSSSDYLEPYTIAHFRNIGQAIAVSLLDMYRCNPFSRLPQTSFGSIDGVKQNLKQQVVRSRKRVKRRKKFVSLAKKNASKTKSKGGELLTFENTNFTSASFTDI